MSAKNSKAQKLSCLQHRGHAIEQKTGMKNVRIETQQFAPFQRNMQRKKASFSFLMLPWDLRYFEPNFDHDKLRCAEVVKEKLHLPIF